MVAINHQITLERSVDVGAWVRSRLVTDDALWLPFWQDDVVARVSRSTGEVLSRTQVGGWPMRPIESAAYIWVPNLTGGTVSRLDPTDGSVVDELDTGMETVSLTELAGSVWAQVQKTSSGGMNGLVQLDIESGAELGRTPAPGRVYDIQVHEEAMWLTYDDGQGLARFEPELGEPEPIDLPEIFAGFCSPVFAFDAVWVPGRGSIWRVDAASGESVGPGIPLPVNRHHFPTNLVSGFGSLWVGLSNDELWRIDPESHEMERVGTGGGEERFLCVAGEYVVVSLFGGSVAFYSGNTGELVTMLDSRARQAVEAFGSLWMQDSEAALVTKARLSDLEIATLDLGAADWLSHPETAWIAWIEQVGDSVFAHIEGQIVIMR